MTSLTFAPLFLSEVSRNGQRSEEKAPQELGSVNDAEVAELLGQILRRLQRKIE